MTRLPLDFPALGELAFDAADDQYRAWLVERAFPELYEQYASLQPDKRGFLIRVQARLLSDLTRPESQAVWLRWLAGQVGVPVPTLTLPAWVRLRTDHCPGWRLGDRVMFSFGEAYYSDFHGVDRQCPALPNPDSPDAPIRALVLAILTVGGGR